MTTRAVLGPGGVTIGLSASSPSALTVLVVEDDSDLRAMLSIVLRTEGHRVVELRDGAELVAAVVREPAVDWRGAAPYLVVIDLRMPELDGLGALRALRDRRESPPFVLITAFPDASVRMEALELGALAVLEKPFDFEHLRAIIRAYVRGLRA